MRITKDDINLYQDKELGFDIHTLQTDLKRALPYLKKGWGTLQNDDLDNLTSFIYNCKTYYEVVKKFEENIPEHEKSYDLLSYTMHRWYNYRTSKTVESMFCRYNIVRAEENQKHKKIDIHILNTPFDIKLTVMPKEFYEKYPNLRDFKNRKVRDDLIRWLYKSQSKEKRYHNANRLFVVCRTKEYSEKNFNNKVLKHKFDKMENPIHNFLTSVKMNYDQGLTPFNRVKINSDGVIYTPLSEIIIINE